MRWYERLLYWVCFVTAFFVWPIVVYAQIGINQRGTATWYGNVGCIFIVFMCMFFVYSTAVALHDNGKRD